MLKFDYITNPDNFMQVPFRFLSTIIVRKIARTKIVPDQVTVFRGILNLIALILFISTDYRALIFAFVLFQINEILDHVDGDLARFKKIHSHRGLFLEYLIDGLGATMYGFLGLCVTIGIYRQTGDIRIFFVFIAILMTLVFTKELEIVLRNREERESVQHAKHGIYISVMQGDNFKRKLQNFITIIHLWQNQIILWAALFYYPIQRYFNINPLFLGMVIVALLNLLFGLMLLFLNIKKLKVIVSERIFKSQC